MALIFDEIQGKVLKIGRDDDNHIDFSTDNQIIFRLNNSEEYFRLDGSATRAVFSKDALFSDNVNLAIGDSLDLFFVHTGTHSFITQQGAGNLYIRNLTNDKDIIFQSDDGSGGVTTYFTVDGSTGMVKFEDDRSDQLESKMEL